MEQSLVIDKLVEEEQVPSPMGELFEEEYDYKRPRRGAIRQAVVLSIEPHQIVVDIRAKRDGIVPETDLERLKEEEISEIEVGDEIPVYVLKTEDDDGNVLVSVNMALVHQDWLRAEEFFKNGEIYEGEVSKCNKGGLIASFGRISGFVPASQVVNMPRRLPHEEKMAKLSEFIGETLPLKVIEVNHHRRRLIFSERAAQHQWREHQKQQLMNELYEGEVRRGTVSSLCNFGAFVDLGGADGLVHISELAWHRVKHPREVLSVGDEVDVYILRLDYERNRIGLSIKRLQPDPWTLVDDKYQVGQVVQGKITNVVAFGAFARLEPGVEGLIHISELAEGRIGHPSSVVKKGDELTLCVISVNAGRRRIGLSLRQAPPPEELAGVEEEPEPELAPDDQAIPGEEQETAEEPVVPEEETEVRAEIEEEEEEEGVTEVEEELEPELAPDDQVILEEVQETAEETVVPEGEAEELAEVEEELEPEVAPDAQVIPEEMQETAEETVVPEGEAEELAEVEEELEPEVAPDAQVIPEEMQETAEEVVVPEEEVVETGEEVTQVETDEETPQES
ncbi:MAG: 30S ribosomal protein S1 [Anaerolineae bacterium]